VSDKTRPAHNNSSFVCYRLGSFSQVVTSSKWSQREGASCLLYLGTIIFAGGQHRGSLYHDVWTSSDGNGGDGLLLQHNSISLKSRARIQPAGWNSRLLILVVALSSLWWLYKATCWFLVAIWTPPPRVVVFGLTES
jgi:hypothetical protein